MRNMEEMLEYGTVVFSPRKKKLIKKVESVQNNFTGRVCVRYIVLLYDGIPFAADRNANLGLETPEFRRKKPDLAMLNKIFYGHCSLILDQFVVERSSFTRKSPQAFASKSQNQVSA